MQLASRFLVGVLNELDLTLRLLSQIVFHRFNSAKILDILNLSYICPTAAVLAFIQSTPDLDLDLDEKHCRIVAAIL